MAFDFGDFEFVARLGIVIFATAIRATTMVLRDGELRLAAVAFADAFHKINHEFAVFYGFAIFDGCWPTLVHKARDDTRGFTNGQRHLMDVREVILRHEVLEGADDFDGIAKFVHRLILLECADGDLDGTLNGVGRRLG